MLGRPQNYSITLETREREKELLQSALSQETHKREWKCTFPTPFPNTHTHHPFTAELRFKVTILPGIPSFTLELGL